VKISEKWLREWVSTASPRQALVDRLTFAGLEVDDVESAAPDFSGIIVGQVLTVEKHPNADKLRLCSVDVGRAEPLSIVCGAANVRGSLKVPVAQIGALLPSGMKIEKAKLRGIESFGMLCSAKELGLAEVSDGLLELPEAASIGEDIRQYLALDDYILDIAITPNRGDCLSVLGLAREVAAEHHLPYTPVDIQPAKVTIDDCLDITIASSGCLRYAGRVIKGLNPQVKTPMWMQERLRRSGIRSIHPVVDVTNYVMLELGQPMHAFDLSTLSHRISVRDAGEGEKLTLLNGAEVSLIPKTLLITDGSTHSPLAIAGIMGGVVSSVTSGTQNIFLESAYFHPIRAFSSANAKKYGLHTDSSYRFERGVDPAIQVMALERATALILEIMGGQAGPVTDVLNPAYPIELNRSIVLQAQKIVRLLGTEIPRQTIEDILTALGFQLTAIPEGWRVDVPSYRFDVSQEVDLIEEVARIYGYSQLEEQTLEIPLTLSSCSARIISAQQIRTALQHRGYQEVVTYSFIDPKKENFLTGPISRLTIKNPMASNMSEMRTTLWTGLLEVLAYNLNRQADHVRIFEIGSRFIVDETGNYREEKVLSGLVYGLNFPEQWGIKKQTVDFFDVKNDLDILFQQTGRVDDFCFISLDKEDKDCKWWVQGEKSAIIYDCDQRIGKLYVTNALAARDMALHYGLPKEFSEICLFELFLEPLQRKVFPRGKPISKFPSVRRDLALILDQQIAAQKLVESIREEAGKLLIDLTIFDVYQGRGIEPGKKSLAIGLTFQSQERTLNVEEVHELVDRIVKLLQNTFGATLREQ